jgi:hypothetical protein
MLTPRLRAALAAAALGGLAACDIVEPSENVDQDRIYTDYEVQYDARTDITAARATFRFGGATGTLLQLSGDSEVLANGDRLTERSATFGDGVYYERSFAGLVPSVAFEFFDTRGTAYHNGIALRAVAPPAVVGPIDNDFAYEIRWAGEPLDFDEEVGAVLYRIVGGGALAVFTQRDVGATSIILDRAQLQNVTPGEATLVLERRTLGDLDEPTEVGGRITARYTAAPVRVEVRE